jgi:hypothetical protein
MTAIDESIDADVAVVAVVAVRELWESATLGIQQMPAMAVLDLQLRRFTADGRRARHVV